MTLSTPTLSAEGLVKQFDDMITRPHIRRYYDYNMMYNEDEDVKGDFSIDARGSSALLIRDIQSQAFLNLLAAGANPVYGMYLDTQKLFEKALQAQHIDPKDVFKSEDELEKIKEQASQPQQAPDNPALAVAKMRGEIEMQKAQAQNQGDMAELQVRQEIAKQEGALRVVEMQLTREIEMLKMSNTQNISLEQIKAKLADTAIKERGKKELYAAEQNLKLQTGSGI